MKRILVTGGQGYIGKYLSNALRKKGYEVVLVARRYNFADKQTIIKDISLLDAKEKLTKDFDVIFHLASIIKIDDMINSPGDTIKNNFDCTINLLEDIRLNNPNCLFVFASSDKVYGNAKQKIVNEDDFGVPLEPYGCSKSISELAIRAYSNVYGIKYVIIRSGNVFGPNQSGNTFIPSLISRIAKGETNLKVGTLKSNRNFTYIEDLIDAFRICMTKKKAINQVFNIMSFNSSMIDVAKEIADATKKIKNREINYIYDQSRTRLARAESGFFVMDCTKAKKMLGWKPKYNLPKALKKIFRVI